MKKKIVKVLKELYSDYCEHEFDEWIDCTTFKDKCITNEPGLVKGYITIRYPLYKRKCKKCGLEEFSDNIEKQKTKKLNKS